LFKPLFYDSYQLAGTVGWRETAVLVGTDVGPLSSGEKMLERLALALLASVLAFALAPYFYALGGL
jgi:hypothetical protein